MRGAFEVRHGEVLVPVQSSDANITFGAGSKYSKQSTGPIDYNFTSLSFIEGSTTELVCYIILFFFRFFLTFTLLSIFHYFAIGPIDYNFTNLSFIEGLYVFLTKFFCRLITRAFRPQIFS